MEKSTVIGLIAGVISIFVGMVVKGAPLSALANPAAFLIIIGGTISCLFNAFTMEQMSKVPTLFKLLMRSSEEQSKGELVKTFVELSQLARREGILALESRVEDIQDPFFKNGLSMVIDGMDPEFVGDVLDAELTIMEQRHAEMRSIFSQAGTYAPTLGVLGAVVGLIAALSDMSDINKLTHAIAAAFVATILGIFTGYVLWLPFANKLKIKSENEVGFKRMIMEGILSLQAGDSPTQIESKLMIYIPQGEREGISSAK